MSLCLCNDYYYFKRNSGEDIILLTTWRQKVGGADKNFTRQSETLHYLSEAIKGKIPSQLI
jgi:hypothetical protein